ILDDAEGVNFEAMLRGEPSKPTITPYSSKLEENIVKLNGLADEYRAVDEADLTKLNDRAAKIVFGDNEEKVFIQEGRRAIAETTKDFLENKLGRLLPQDEQLAIWQALDDSKTVLGN